MFLCQTTGVKIHIGSDHAGLEFKAKIIDHLKLNGNDVTDHGPFEYDAQDDYPTFCIPTAQAVAKDPNSFGIVLGGSGNGCLLYTSPSPRDGATSRMPSSA